MITNKGKAIITKFLAGQASTYASYIAVGCGHKPGTSSGTAARDLLDFEMVRVAVSSVSVITDPVTDVTSIVFSAELPTQNRYSVSEVGLYSGASNPVAVSDSRIIFDFTKTERWEAHNTISSYSIPDYSSIALGTGNVIDINERLDESLEPVAESPMFSISSDDSMFTNQERIVSKEQSRMFTDTLWMRGNTSELSVNADGYLSPSSNSSHIHYTGLSIMLDANSSEDRLKLAYAVSKIDTDYPDPDKIKILVQFSSDETEADGGQFASLEYDATSASYDLTGDPSTSNSYMVLDKMLSEIKKTSLFSWSQAKIAKIFVSTELNAGSVSYSITNNVVTAVTNLEHHFVVGNSVYVSGLGDIADGTYTITAADTIAKTVSFAYTHENVTSTADTNATIRSASGAYYVTLDAMRVDNVYDMKLNPLYGLVAYADVSKSVDVSQAYPGSSTFASVTKGQNENSYIEIKIPVDIGGA